MKAALASSWKMSPAKVDQSASYCARNTLASGLQQLYESKSWISGRWSSSSFCMLARYGLCIKYLEPFRQMNLRRIHRNSLGDRITDSEILFQTSLHSIEVTILQHRLHWAIRCLECVPLNYQVSSCLENSSAARGYAKKSKRRFKDMLKHMPTSTLRPGKSLLKILFPGINPSARGLEWLTDTFESNCQNE